MSIVTRADLEASLAELARGVQDPHAGILGPRSIAWQVGGDLGVFLGGGRAALLQLAHPFVAYAVEQHSKTRADVVGRFQRTFRNVFAMVFGELDDDEQEDVLPSDDVSRPAHIERETPIDFEQELEEEERRLEAEAAAAPTDDDGAARRP